MYEYKQRVPITSEISYNIYPTSDFKFYHVFDAFFFINIFKIHFQIH